MLSTHRKHLNKHMLLESNYLKNRNGITEKAYVFHILIKDCGAVIFGVLLGCLITSLVVHDQSVHFVIRNEPVVREEAHSVDVTVANQLSKEIRVLCWITTTSAFHQSRAQHVKDTWGRRCSKLLFMSNVTDNFLGSVGLNLTVEDNHLNLWDKTKLSLEYIHKHHLNDYDWFLKADDDSYVIMENLRYLLHRYSTEHPLYFGFPFRNTITPFQGQCQIYMAGGAGYVMSREALERLVELGFADEKVCSANIPTSEDVHIGHCLARLNVSAIDTRDSAGRGTFFPFDISAFLVPNRVEYAWYKKMKVINLSCPNCCSDRAISFHYVSPTDMHVYEYFIYSLHPYGVIKYPKTLKRKLTEQEIKKIF